MKFRESKQSKQQAPPKQQKANTDKAAKVKKEVKLPSYGVPATKIEYWNNTYQV